MKSYNPTSPSRRQMTTVDYSTVTTDVRFKPLTRHLQSHAGRNHKGRITVRHQGGGNKKAYRMVDFKQDKLNIPARIETIEYDPYRTAFIALALYRDGERRYILAPQGMKVGDEIVVAESAPLVTGNRLMLKHFPTGMFVYNVEMRPGNGGKIARSAGTYAEVMGQSDGYTDLRLSSKETRRVPWNGYASVGQLSNAEWNLVNIGKAGRSRWLGIRPTVRGSAMNPVDHPYGGGEGKQPRGTKRPKTRWGKVTGGRKTRKHKKWSTQFITQRRPKVR
ncbi:MAG: 50S ribosomal protein L2 [bacterium]|nr:50S ribosomal protein L2 [bacterium]